MFKVDFDESEDSGAILVATHPLRLEEIDIPSILQYIQQLVILIWNLNIPLEKFGLIVVGNPPQKNIASLFSIRVPVAFQPVSLLVESLLEQINLIILHLRLNDNNA